MEHLSTFLSGIATTCAIALFIFVWNSNKDIALLKRAVLIIPGMEAKLIELIGVKLKVDILYGFWEKEVQAAITIVHKPHEDAKELDALLDKFKILMDKFTTHNLNDEDLIQLVKLLEEVKANNNAPSGDRLAAARILNYIEMRYQMMQLGI